MIIGLGNDVIDIRRVERTIISLQGLFIKVGQLLSIMANFLPEEFRSELEGLQDQVPPRPLDILARVLSRIGDPDRAISTLEKLLSIPYEAPLAANPPLTPALLRLDPMFRQLRNDARFQKLANAQR